MFNNQNSDCAIYYIIVYEIIISNLISYKIFFFLKTSYWILQSISIGLKMNVEINNRLP